MQKEGGDVYFKAVWTPRYVAAGSWQQLCASHRVLGERSGGCEGCPAPSHWGRRDGSSSGALRVAEGWGVS